MHVPNACRRIPFARSGNIDYAVDFRAYELDPAFECSGPSKRVPNPGDALRLDGVGSPVSHACGIQWCRRCRAHAGRSGTGGFNIRPTYILTTWRRKVVVLRGAMRHSRSVHAEAATLCLLFDPHADANFSFRVASQHPTWTSSTTNNNICHCHRGSKTTHSANQRKRRSRKRPGVSSHRSQGCQLVRA